MIHRKATQSDLDYVRSNPFEGAVKHYPYSEVPDENCYAVERDGELIGVYGLQVKWQGTGLLWLMLTNHCKKDGREAVLGLLEIRKRIDFMIADTKVWRAEASVRVDFPKAIKMLEFLGFKREGLMRCYCPDKSDSFLYSRIL